MRAIVLLALISSPAILLGAAGARADTRITPLSVHDKVRVGGEVYKLVTAADPLVVGLERDSAKKPRRVVIDVVRLGKKGEGLRGRTPLVARVRGARRRILPVRPRLVRSRLVAERDWIASWPVRYRVRLPEREVTSLRLELLKPAAGGQVGVLVRYESDADQLAPLDGPIKSRVITGRTYAAGRKPKPKKPDPPDKPYVSPRLAKMLKEPPSEAATKVPLVDAGAVPEPLAAVDAGAPEDPGAPPLDAGAAPDAGPPPPEPAVEPPAVLLVELDDRLSGPFRLVEHRVEVNDRTVAEALVDDTGESLPRQGELFRGELEPGPHQVRVSLVWEGEGGFLFTYLREYAFIVEDEAELKARSGQTVRVRAVGYNEGGFFTDMLEQPAIRLEVE